MCQGEDPYSLAVHVWQQSIHQKVVNGHLRTGLGREIFATKEALTHLAKISPTQIKVGLQ